MKRLLLTAIIFVFATAVNVNAAGKRTVDTIRFNDFEWWSTYEEVREVIETNNDAWQTPKKTGRLFDSLDESDENSNYVAFKTMSVAEYDNVLASMTFIPSISDDGSILTDLSSRVFYLGTYFFTPGISTLNGSTLSFDEILDDLYEKLTLVYGPPEQYDSNVDFASGLIYMWNAEDGSSVREVRADAGDGTEATVVLFYSAPNVTIKLDDLETAIKENAEKKEFEKKTNGL